MEQEQTDKISTKSKIIISLIVGTAAAALTWITASLEPLPYVEEEHNFDEGAMEYSSPEVLNVPSSMLGKVRDGGDILLYWTDKSGRNFFKTVNQDHIDEELDRG